MSKVIAEWSDPRGVYGREPTLVETVAFAICSCKPCICRNKAGFTGMPCLDHARKGIEAMRDPTGEMYIAGANAIPGDAATMEILIDYLGAAWRAQIDAALREDKP